MTEAAHDGGGQRKLGVGVAGLGIAGTQSVQRLASHPKVELIAAADVRPQALTAFREQYGGRAFDTVEAMCQDPEVEAIWISTPNHLHCEHVVTAARNGTHAVVQKPMAVSLDEAKRMVEASEQYGTKLLAGHSTALRPPFRAMRRMVDWGELGRLCAINVWSYTDWMLRPRMPQEVDLARGGGLVYRQGPHQVDAVRLIGGGLVRSVRAMTGQWMPERPCPGYYSAYLEFEDGTPATIVHNGYGYFLASELVPWGVDLPRTSVDERNRARNALRNGGEADEERAKEALRFGAQRDETAGRRGNARTATTPGSRPTQASSSCRSSAAKSGSRRRACTATTTTASRTCLSPCPALPTTQRSTSSTTPSCRTRRSTTTVVGGSQRWRSASPSWSRRGSGGRYTSNTRSRRSTPPTARLTRDAGRGSPYALGSLTLRR